MGLFSRKSRWEQMLEMGAGAAATMGASRALKVGGVVAGALGLTAASAALSSRRAQEQQQ